MADRGQNTMKSPEVAKEMKNNILRQQLFSPTDNLVSPCTQKLMGMKGRGKQRLLHQAFKGAAKNAQLHSENVKENITSNSA